MDKKEIQSNKNWSRFRDSDPFNDNYVEGYICHSQSNQYGALFIDKVNGDSVPQLILCTPKLHYPFDKNGGWHFPTAIKIERYRKLDGTNVFQFRYKDKKGRSYVSYKTRLRPFLGESKFGPFLTMWKDILSKHPIISALPDRLNLNISYELWGQRNSHLILYEENLEASVLFARRKDIVIPPSEMGDLENVNSADFHGLIDRDYIYNYQAVQVDLETKLKEIDDMIFRGEEGEVWYLLDTDGLWHLLKCKPASIESIHFASSGGLPKFEIIATAQNAFENWDNPTVDNVMVLLEETRSSLIVAQNYDRIKKYLDIVKTQFEFKSSILDEYEELGISILEDKVSVMRALSSKFSKSQMSYVYSTIWADVIE